MIFRFLLLEAESAETTSEDSCLTGVSGSRDEDAIADGDDAVDDGARTDMGDDDGVVMVVLVMMGDGTRR